MTEVDQRNSVGRSEAGATIRTILLGMVVSAILVICAWSVLPSSYFGGDKAPIYVMVVLAIVASMLTYLYRRYRCDAAFNVLAVIAIIVLVMYLLARMFAL